MKKILLVLLSLPLFSNGQITYPSGYDLDSTTFTFSNNDSLIHYLPNGTWCCPTTQIVIDTSSAVLWQIGNTHKPVFSNSFTACRGIMTDTVNHYSRNANDFFTLRMDHILPNFILDIWHKYQTDSMHAGGYIEYSTDTGVSWMNIANCNQIVAQKFYSSTDTLISGEPAFMGNSNGEQLSRVQFINCWAFRTTVTSCIREDNYGDGVPIYFRFHFVSDSTIDSLSGWMIDSIRIEDPGCFSGGLVSKVNKGGEIMISPNPTSSELTLSSPDNIATVSIFNLLGQTIYSNQFNSSNVQVNVTELAAGVYFVKVNGSYVQKFVKR